MKKLILLFLVIFTGCKSDKEASPVTHEIILENISKTFKSLDVVKEHVRFVNTVHSSREILVIEGGTFLEGMTNDDGAVKLYGGRISKDFINNRGAVYINGKNEVFIEGAFKSIGQPTLSKHRNPTNGLRITVGEKPLEASSAVFDEHTEINVVLTDDFPSFSVIDVKTGLYFGSRTIFNFEKSNKKPIPKGTKFKLFRAKTIHLSQSNLDDRARYPIEYRGSSAATNYTGADLDSIEITKEKDPNFEYLVVTVKKEITPS